MAEEDFSQGYDLGPLPGAKPNIRPAESSVPDAAREARWQRFYDSIDNHASTARITDVVVALADAEVAAAVLAVQADNNRRIEALAGLRSDAIEKIRTRWLNTKYVVPYEVKLDPRNLDYAQISRDFDALFAAIEVARAALASPAEPGGAE